MNAGVDMKDADAFGLLKEILHEFCKMEMEIMLKARPKDLRMII